MTQVDVDVAIVGAGLAGLACAARLRRNGVKRFAVLEQGEGVGGFWRGNYDRMRLHSPYHDLPDDGGLRRRHGIFLRRNQLLSYLEAYSRHHGLGPHLHCGERVGAIRRARTSWEVEANSDTFSARAVVVATSANRRPVLPELPGRHLFAGHQLHSRDYRHAAPFEGHRVLVVGSGNSATEIALDLVEGGARSVALWVRAPRHVLSLRKLGVAARMARLLRLGLTPKKLAEGHRFTRTHPEWEQRLRQRDALFTRFAVDLSAHGIRRPEEGPATQMCRRARVAWYDQGTAAAITAGRIEVIDGNRHPIETLTERGVRFSHQERAFDTVIYGTGFEPALEEFLEDADKLLYWNPDTRRRMPRTDGRCRSAEDPTLFFPGFDITLNGGLSLGLWGFEIADAVTHQLRS